MQEPLSDELLREAFSDYLDSALPALCHVDNLTAIAEGDRYDRNGRRYRHRPKRFLSVEFRAAIAKHNPALALSLGAILPGTNEPVQPSSNGSANGNAKGSPNPARGTGTKSGFRPSCGIALPEGRPVGSRVNRIPSTPCCK
jgi:hypothetical protein